MERHERHGRNGTAQASFIRVFLFTCAAGLMVGSASADVTISYRGADTTTAASWRSTDVSKNATFDVDGDNAYGTAGYALISNQVPPGDPLTPANWITDLPAFVTLTASSGNLWWFSGYPDIDDPAQSIGPTVADLTGGEPSSFSTPTVTFTMNSAQDFVFSMLNTHSDRGPGTLTVTGPGGVFARAYA